MGTYCMSDLCIPSNTKRVFEVDLPPINNVEVGERAHPTKVNEMDVQKLYTLVIFDLTF